MFCRVVVVNAGKIDRELQVTGGTGTQRGGWLVVVVVVVVVVACINLYSGPWHGGCPSSEEGFDSLAVHARAGGIVRNDVKLLRHHEQLGRCTTRLDAAQVRLDLGSKRGQGLGDECRGAEDATSGGYVGITYTCDRTHQILCRVPTG